jgi:hypothetical protein
LMFIAHSFPWLVVLSLQSPREESNLCLRVRSPVLFL